MGMIFRHLRGAFCCLSHFLLASWKGKMRACFLGQNICSLGFGIATLQAPPLVMDTPVEDLQQEPGQEHQTAADQPGGWKIPTAAGPVANPQRSRPDPH
jgi:hypothetical protein